MRHDEVSARAAHAPFSRRAVPLAGIAIVALTVVLASLFFASRGSVSAGQLGTGTASSRSGPPPWIRVEPSLAGKWLHWRQYGYYDNPDAPDPAIGKLMIADTWERIGSDKVPTLFHQRITFAESGGFYQEVYESSTASITVRGPAYKSVYPAEVSLSTTWCVQRWPADPGRLPKLAPDFADEQGVQAAGFALTTHGPLHAPPATPGEPFSPARVFSVPQQLHQWDQRRTSSQGFAAITTLQIDASGRVVYRVVYEEWRTVDPRGKTVKDTWLSRGDLYVYPGDAPIPAAVTSPPEAPPGRC